jgi:hypothetical protein
MLIQTAYTLNFILNFFQEVFCYRSGINIGNSSWASKKSKLFIGSPPTFHYSLHEYFILYSDKFVVLVTY